MGEEMREETHSVKLRGRVRRSIFARACAEHRREGKREGERREIGRAGQDLVIHVPSLAALEFAQYTYLAGPAQLSP